MQLSDEQIDQIASQIAEELRKQPDIRDIAIGETMGAGGIPLHGREGRTEPCSCCLIDPEGPNAPHNRMCTTSDMVGTMSDKEEQNLCSEINLVRDGRCERARAIRQAAKTCKEKYPENTKQFFQCFAPSFSEETK